jgi:hypothetical protein
MRNTFIAVCLTFCALEAAAASPAPVPSATPWSAWSRTRPLSPGAINLLKEAVLRSAIVEDLLEQIERTDLVVYLADSMPGAFVGPKSTMVFLAGDTPSRFLLIRVDAMRLPLLERIAALGHELHHALEVAAAPEVRGALDMIPLYRRIGWETSKGRFETREAQAIAWRISKQLGRRDRGQKTARVEDGVSAPRAASGPSEQ